MKYLVICLSMVAAVASCTTVQDKQSPALDGEKYKLALNPAPGSVYEYSVSNESSTTVEIEGKKIETTSDTDVDIQYQAKQDSNGNFLLETRYNTISFRSENNGVKTAVEVNKETVAVTPMEKMMKLLKEAVIVATISPAGEVKNVSGFDELENKLIAQFASNDQMAVSQARHQWQQMVGEGIVKKNLDQLFRLFPDSSVREGDTWRILSKENGDFKINLASDFTLTKVTDKTASISSKGKINSDNQTTTAFGPQATITLNGDQEAQYDLDPGSGMLKNAKLRMQMEGTVQMMGRNVPVKVTTSIDVKSKGK